VIRKRHAFAGLRRLRALALLAIVASASAGAAADEYEDMLGYLVQSRIDGRVLAGSQGALALNQAAGDLNQQANLRALAVGDRAHAQIHARQRQLDQTYDRPASASAVIGGQVLAGAGGLASINQASGSGNTETNVLTAQLGQPGTHQGEGETRIALAPAQRQRASGAPLASSLHRETVVEAGALRGFEGVLQLNQIAGSANQAGNGFAMSVQP